MKSKVDVDALKLTPNASKDSFLKGWFEDRIGVTSGLCEASLKLLLIILRILFSPFSLFMSFGRPEKCMNR